MNDTMWSFFSCQERSFGMRGERKSPCSFVQCGQERGLMSTEEFANQIGEVVSLRGSIYRIRKMRGFAFVLLRTATGVVQCVYEEGTASFSLQEICEESCVELTAMVIAEPRSRTGWELHLQTVQVLSRPVEVLPVVVNHKEVDTSLETLLDYRPITLRNEKERGIFRIQAGICEAFRTFLGKNGFTEIHTPKLVHAGAEGGANIFKLDYFGKEAYLAQSPQFYKQMGVGVFERVYEIAPVFRAEKHDTSRHLNEYTSVDFEMGYIQGFEEIMQMEAGMLRFCMEWLEERYQKELALLGVKLPTFTEIPVMKFREAKETVAQVYRREIKDWKDFEPEEEKLLCNWIYEQTGSEFVFVTHYPSEKRPFYAMEDASCPEETRSFDLLFRGLEITTGGQRIHDYEMQLEKLQRRGMNPQEFESYLMMHRYGMPPHGGLGLGLERFTARLLNFENVRRTTMFPRDIHRLEP